ncbi:MAG: dihydropteroate synthase, partial [Bacteroidales bacterium]
MAIWSDKITPFPGNRTLNCGNNVLIIDKPLVMGILNLTPDSFFDGGYYANPDSWISQTEKMISEGASIIDLGAVSTRPGAEYVSEESEIKRLIPGLEMLVKRFPKMVFSVDTYRSRVAKHAASAGAGLINDISAGSLDAELLKTVGETGLPYILMHIQGTPQTMQVNPDYKDVTEEVCLFFGQKLAEAAEAGIKEIMLDPGFGFGKTIEHNYQLLNKLNIFKQFGCPVLVGLSRKSMIYKLLEISPAESL